MEYFLESLFLNIFIMSITASYVILFVILVRFFLKKTPKILSYSLWGVVLFRLICPFSLSSDFSFFNFLNINNTSYIPTDIGMLNKPSINVGLESINNVINQSLPQATQVASVNPMQIIIYISSLVWIIGVLSLTSYSIISYIILKRKISTAMFICNKIFESEKIDSPFVIGIIKPKIYLPLNLNENEKLYILEHEKIHIKRFDYLIKPLGFLVLCLHWFNPIVWIGFYLMSKDMEMACDEGVIRSLGNEIKKDYSRSLLSLAASKKFISGSPLAFGENNTKNRIKNVLNYKRPELILMLLCLIIVIISIIGLILNPSKIVSIFETDMYINMQIFDNILDITVETTTNEKLSPHKVYLLNDESNVEQTIKLLKNLKVNKQPLNKNRSEDRFKDHVIILYQSMNNIIHSNFIYFNQYYTQAWVNNGVKPSFTYDIKNHAIVREYFENIKKNRVPVTRVTSILKIEDVYNLALKGEDLSWNDFNQYTGTDIGSGLYIMMYIIDERYKVLVGGVPNEKPMYIYLIHSPTDERIDIRREDVTTFIKNHK